MENYLLLVVIPNLDCFFGSLGVIGIVTCIILFIGSGIQYSDAYDDADTQKAIKNIKTVCKIFAVSMFLFFITCFIPTKKDMIQLKAISIISELQGVEKIPQKVVDRLNDLLDAGEKDGK